MVTKSLESFCVAHLFVFEFLTSTLTRRGLKWNVSACQCWGQKIQRQIVLQPESSQLIFLPLLSTTNHLIYSLPQFFSNLVFEIWKINVFWGNKKLTRRSTFARSITRKSESWFWPNCTRLVVCYRTPTWPSSFHSTHLDLQIWLWQIAFSEVFF